jgi:hypothetical protein
MPVSQHPYNDAIVFLRKEPSTEGLKMDGLVVRGDKVIGKVQTLAEATEKGPNVPADAALSFVVHSRRNKPRETIDLEGTTFVVRRFSEPVPIKVLTEAMRAYWDEPGMRLRDQGMRIDAIQRFDRRITDAGLTSDFERQFYPDNDTLELTSAVEAHLAHIKPPRIHHRSREWQDLQRKAREKAQEPPSR